MEAEEDAVDFVHDLEYLSNQNPELRELKEKMQELVTRMLNK